MAETACLLCALGYLPYGPVGETPHVFTCGPAQFMYACPQTTWRGVPQGLIMIPGMPGPPLYVGPMDNPFFEAL